MQGRMAVLPAKVSGMHDAPSHMGGHTACKHVFVFVFVFGRWYNWLIAVLYVFSIWDDVFFIWDDMYLVFGKGI